MTELVAVRRDVVLPGVPPGVGGSTGVSDAVMQHVLEVLNELKAGQIRLEAGQAKLEAGLTSVEGGQAKLEAGQAKVEAGLTSVEAGQAKLEAGQATLEAGLTSVKASQTSLRVDLMARMDRLENINTAIRDDISVNFGAVDAVRRANDNTRDELRALSDVVSLMHRQINRLQTEVEQLKGPT
jgi:uncharacterized phage infection (PIP) family protein YhgE